MTIRVYKRTSAGRRNASVNLHTEVTKKKPEKSLLAPKKRTGGRNHKGIITVRGRGGGHKRRYRKIDFKRRDRAGIRGTVVGIEYDPNRTAHIALIEYEDGVKRYILAPVGLKDGDTVISSEDRVEPAVGNRMPLRNIPTGLPVHCIEMHPNRGGQMCRSAGSFARLTNRQERWATLVFPSGEIRQLSIDCWATIGQVGNTDHQHRRLGKAGKSRHLGRRPKVRGVAMSHHCHPLGGGEGRSKGDRAPASATGLQAKGGGTRNKKKPSSKRIIRRRKSVRYGQLRT
jgi:large subunit ribosomal protein L2